MTVIHYICIRRILSSYKLPSSVASIDNNNHHNSINMALIDHRVLLFIYFFPFRFHWLYGVVRFLCNSPWLPASHVITEYYQFQMTVVIREWGIFFLSILFFASLFWFRRFAVVWCVLVFVSFVYWLHIARNINFHGIFFTLFFLGLNHTIGILKYI